MESALQETLTALLAEHDDADGAMAVDSHGFCVSSEGAGLPSACSGAVRGVQEAAEQLSTEGETPVVKIKTTKSEITISQKNGITTAVSRTSSS